jgi:hypothetical protein
MNGIHYTQLGYRQLTTTLSSAVSLPSIPPAADAVLLQAETQNVRFRDDGTAPTTSVGMLLVAGAEAFMYTGALMNLQFIAATSGAILNITYYKIAG